MRQLFFLLIWFGAGPNTFAQYAPPVKDSLFSAILNEQRDIDITLPENYAADTTRYDVWYVVDGEWNTFTFTNIARYVKAIGFMPNIIIVSVPNRYVNGFNLRDRDLTPTKIADVDSSGGAAHFLDFFEKELMPYIRQKYRTSGECGLFGSSFGGLFTLYALLERPTLFRFYAVSDPALHNDNQYLPNLAAQRLPHLAVRNTVLNIGGRSGLSYHSMARDKMDSVLKAYAPEGLHWHSALYDNETHSSVTFKSNYDGLRYAYLGYSSRETRFHLTGGIILREQPVRLFLFTDNADMRYTTDGSAPTRNSPRVDEFLIVSDPSQLRVRSFSSSGCYDRDIPMGLTTGDYVTAKKLSRKMKSAAKLDLQSRLVDGVMNGVVTVSNEGYYVLQLTPSAGTKLFLNDSLIVAYHPSTGHARETILLPLRKGNYAFRLEHPSTNKSDPPLGFGFYRSENGQDDWWKNPLVKW